MIVATLTLTAPYSTTVFLCSSRENSVAAVMDLSDSGSRKALAQRTLFTKQPNHEESAETSLTVIHPPDSMLFLRQLIGAPAENSPQTSVPVHAKRSTDAVLPSSSKSAAHGSGHMTVDSFGDLFLGLSLNLGLNPFSVQEERKDLNGRQKDLLVDTAHPTGADAGLNAASPRLCSPIVRQRLPQQFPKHKHPSAMSGAGRIYQRRSSKYSDEYDMKEDEEQLHVLPHQFVERPQTGVRITTL